MVDLITVIVSGLVSFSIAILVSLWKDVFIFKNQVEYSRKKELIEKRLNNLYSPLHFYILRSEQRIGKTTISWGVNSKEKGESREKEFLDVVIEKNSHLASEELQKLLSKFHGVGAYHMNQVDHDKLIELIKKEYKELKTEFYDLKSQL